MFYFTSQDGFGNGRNAAKNSTFQLFNKLPSPIPEMIQDKKQVLWTWNNLNIIPYYVMDGGAMADSYLNFLWMCGRMSPSLQTAINTKSEFAYADPGIKYAVNKSFTGKEVDVPESMQESIGSVFTDMGLLPSDVVDTTKAIYRHMAESGNVYLHLRAAKVGKSWGISARPIDYRYLRLWKTDMTKILYSRRWDILYLSQVPPTILPYNQWNETEDGAMEMVLHIKNNSDLSPYYGAPALSAAIPYAANEMFQGEWLNKETAGDFVSRVVFFFEQAAEYTQDTGITDYPIVDTSGVKEVKKILVNSLTRQGENSEGVSVIDYPNGTKEPKAVTLPPMTNEKFVVAMSELDQNKIFSIHGWSAVLAGVEKPNASLGGADFLQEFKVRNIGTIKPMQTWAGDIWHKVFKSFSLVIPRPELTEYTFSFKSPYQSLIDEQQPAQNPAQPAAV